LERRRDKKNDSTLLLSWLPGDDEAKGSRSSLPFGEALSFELELRLAATILTEILFFSSISFFHSRSMSSKVISHRSLGIKDIWDITCPGKSAGNILK